MERAGCIEKLTDIREAVEYDESASMCASCAGQDDGLYAGGNVGSFQSGQVGRQAE